jgi:hypothetical protein
MGKSKLKIPKKFGGKITTLAWMEEFKFKKGFPLGFSPSKHSKQRMNKQELLK